MTDSHDLAMGLLKQGRSIIHAFAHENEQKQPNTLYCFFVKLDGERHWQPVEFVAVVPARVHVSLLPRVGPHVIRADEVVVVLNDAHGVSSCCGRPVGWAVKKVGDNSNVGRVALRPCTFLLCSVRVQHTHITMGVPENFVVQDSIVALPRTWPCAAIGVILLTPMKENFKDPDMSVAKAAGADTWSIPAIIALLIGMFLIVTGAGYSVTYLMQRTPTPTVLSATLSVGGILMALAVGGILFKESLSPAQYAGIALSVIALPLLVVRPVKKGNYRRRCRRLLCCLLLLLLRILVDRHTGASLLLSYMRMRWSRIVAPSLLLENSVRSRIFFASHSRMGSSERAESTP